MADLLQQTVYLFNFFLSISPFRIELIYWWNPNRSNRPIGTIPWFCFPSCAEEIGKKQEWFMRMNLFRRGDETWRGSRYISLKWKGVRALGTGGPLCFFIRKEKEKEKRYYYRPVNNRTISPYRVIPQVKLFLVWRGRKQVKVPSQPTSFVHFSFLFSSLLPGRRIPPLSVDNYCVCVRGGWEGHVRKCSIRVVRQHPPAILSDPI